MQHRLALGAQIRNLAADEIAVIMSTDALARDGHVLVTRGCVLENYRKNPIVLWSHDPTQPIGNAESIEVGANAITATVRFAPPGASARADEIRALAKSGVIRAVSVGFDAIDMQPLDPKRPRGGQRITRWELLELSLVSTPADPGAMIIGRSNMTPGANPRWEVMAARNLPVIDQDEFDPGEAAQAIFRWAGGAGFDPHLARRGFLLHDATNPGERGSYKLPIAQAMGDHLVVPHGAIRACAARIAHMDLPDSTRATAVSVIDGYRARAGLGELPAQVSAGLADRLHRQRQAEALQLGNPMRSHPDLDRRLRQSEALRLAERRR